MQWIRRLVTVLVLLLLVLGGVAGFGWWRAEQRLNRHWDVAAPPLAVVSDAEAVARGAHLAQTRGCADCHDADLGGRVMIDDAVVARIVAPNLSGGRGGVLARYGDAELARLIRHGIKADGRSAVVMPSLDYHPLSDADTAALIAYLRQLPAVDRMLGESRIGPMGRALLVFGNAPWIVAETIDHARSRETPPPPAVSVDYGRYVAATCLTCHGANYAGGLVNGPPGTPPSANLTPGGRLAAWTETQFVAALREGRTPDGRQLEPKLMPWPAFAKMDDIELRAMWAFLQSLPPVSAAPR